MKLPVMSHRDEDFPPCFGKEWDPSEPDCRDRCLCFSPCGEETRGAKVDYFSPSRIGREVAPQVLPILGRTRPEPPTQTAPNSPQSLLSVPEVIRPDDTPWSLLSRELVRGIGKSIGWTVANFFDHVPLGNLLRRKKKL